LNDLVWPRGSAQTVETNGQKVGMGIRIAPGTSKRERKPGKGNLERVRRNGGSDHNYR